MNGSGKQNDLHMLRVSCDAPPTKQHSSRGVDLLTSGEHCINNHLTRVQAQMTGHRQCESRNAWCILLGTNYSGK